MVVEWGRAICRAVIQFVYPPVCHWCQRLLSGDAGQQEPFCQSCRNSFTSQTAHRCRRCSAPVGPNLQTETGCIHCKRDHFHFSGVASLGGYQDELKKACLKGKLAHQFTLTTRLADLMCRSNADTLREWKIDMVVPVPHYWVDRLYSSTAANAVCESLSRFLDVPMERHLLCKVSRTKKQTELSGQSRRTNLQGAFRVRQSSRLQGRRVLLADDILTTGSTANRCTQALLQAGAAHVFVAVLARGIGS